MRDLGGSGGTAIRRRYSSGRCSNGGVTGIYLCDLGGGGSVLSGGFGDTWGQREKVGFMSDEDCPG